MPESTRKRSSATAKAAAQPEVEAAPAPAKTAKAGKAAKAAEPAETKPAKPAKAAKVAKAAPEPAEAADQPDATGDGAEPEFLNRAARRAKGRKDAGQQPVAGRGSAIHGRGSVPGQRQWGNRRTGG
jgi:hypothetical protein